MKPELEFDCPVCGTPSELDGRDQKQHRQQAMIDLIKQVDRALDVELAKFERLQVLSNAIKQYLANYERNPPIKERPPENIACATQVILRDYPEMHLDDIRPELQKRFKIVVEKKILRTILDRWLEDKNAKPKFKRTKRSTYALAAKSVALLKPNEVMKT